MPRRVGDVHLDFGSTRFDTVALESVRVPVNGRYATPGISIDAEFVSSSLWSAAAMSAPITARNAGPARSWGMPRTLSTCAACSRGGKSPERA